MDEWKWSSYQAMIGEVLARPRLETDWIFGNSKRRKLAISKYIDFVKEGIGLPSHWENLQNQILLGTEKFINKKQNLISKKKSLSEAPQLHKRKLPKPVEYYERKYKDQKKKQSVMPAYPADIHCKK